jgi:predicted GNAT family N-acyltransferase
MLEIIKFTVNINQFSDPAFEIRRKVFVIEQQVPADEEFDEYEKESQHFLAIYNNIPAGTARWRFTNYGIKLERFAVLEEFRKMKVGSKILSEILKEVVPFDKKIYLHAQIQAVDFYQKFGFVKKGEIFSECDIEHYKMELDS